MRGWVMGMFRCLAVLVGVCGALTVVGGSARAGIPVSGFEKPSVGAQSFVNVVGTPASSIAPLLPAQVRPKPQSTTAAVDPREDATVPTESVAGAPTQAMTTAIAVLAQELMVPLESAGTAATSDTVTGDGADTGDASGLLDVAWVPPMARPKPATIPPAPEPTGETVPGRVAATEPALTPYRRDCLAAEDGNAAAAYRMGRRFLFGMGVRRNRQTGIAWMRSAARLGSPQARRVVSLVPQRWGRFNPSCSGGWGGGGGRGFIKPPAEIVTLVNEIAPRYRLDPKLVLAVIQVESAFRVRAVSPKRAAGLMQLIPATARRFGVADVFNARDNIHGGSKYLRWLLAYFEGDVKLALAGYNAGENAVNRYRGVPPFRETQNYVRLVGRLYAKETHPYDPSVVAPSPILMRQTADASTNGG